MKNIHEQVHDQGQGQNFDDYLNDTVVLIKSDESVFPKVNTEKEHQRIAENRNNAQQDIGAKNRLPFSQTLFPRKILEYGIESQRTDVDSKINDQSVKSYFKNTCMFKGFEDWFHIYFKRSNCPLRFTRFL